MNPLFEPGPRWVTLPGDPPELRRELIRLRAAAEDHDDAEEMPWLDR